MKQSKRTTHKIDKTKIQFFDKLNKTDKPLATLIEKEML